jgi:hypothetical protein
MDVRDAEGVLVGLVAAARPNFILVEEGVLNPTGYAVPYDAVDAFDNATVWLTVGRDELRLAEPERD